MSQAVAGTETSERSDGIIRADKSGWQRAAMLRLVRGKMRAAFRSVLVQGVPELRASLQADERGVLFLLNHSSWWDLFMAHTLSEFLPLDGYLMTIHFNMLRFGMLKRIGGFSIDPTNSRRVKESMDYAAALLKRPRSAVWMCPQGEIRANDVRPLGFQAGVRLLLKRAGSLRVVPLALRYEFWQDERPHAFARFGPIEDYQSANAGEFVETCEQRLTMELDQLREDVRSQAAGKFMRVLRGKGSMNDQYAKLRARFLGKTPGAPDDF